MNLKQLSDFREVVIAGASDSPLVNHDLQRLEYVCAVPIDHDLADKEIITAKDLDGEPMGDLLADIMTSAHRPLSNLALAFIEVVRTEISRIRDGKWHPN